MNISLALSMIADAAPDRIAVGRRDGGLSYAQLRQQSIAVARNLARLDVRTLVLAGANTHACPALLFGSALALVPFCSVNYRLADDRLRDAIARTARSVVVADEATAPRLKGIPGTQLMTFDELTAPGPAASPDPEADPGGDSVAISLFTSGTTGDPKAAVLRHRHLFSYVISTAEFCSAAPEEAALVSVPPYHIAGLAAILSNTYAGRRIVYMPQFDPQGWVSLAAEQHITHAMIVPTMLGRILGVMAERHIELPSLRHLSYGGGRTPVQVVERAMSMLPDVDFVNAYGLTETSSTIALLGPDDHRTAAASADPAIRARLGSVGRALPGVQIEIRDSDGRLLPPYA